ncbi:MAG: response regulator transcription factor, partial [Gammaproteobacteria bacterium]
VGQDRPNGAAPSMEHETSAFQRLTPREGEVLARLRQGKPNKIIAFELDIAESTVKVFVRRILGKLHVSNRTQLALLAHRQSAGAQPNGTC